MAVAGRIQREFGDLSRGLEDKIGDARAARRALALAEKYAADERLALATMVRLADEAPESMRYCLQDPERGRALAIAAGGSEIIATELTRAGAGWFPVFEDARTESADSILSQMRCDLSAIAERAEAVRVLTEFKRSIFLKIAIADLTRRIDVNGTMSLMSRLADECIRAAFGFAIRTMGDRAAEAGEFCVLAMGKLGAGELNLSSDIDLVYIYKALPAGDGSVAAARIGETVTEVISAGCFRVDMRLRPGGRNSPLAVPFEGALGFYQALGQTWERAALLRARPVAGTLALGNRLLAELDRFIYRHYLDFDTLRQLRAMKRQIEVELRSPEMVQRNLKLGYGGIRELEFIIQALTLIYGGRDPRIRTARTIDALDRLASRGYMPHARARSLAEAYLFLRDAEHKLQIVAGLQTHTLPAASDLAGRRMLAARMGLGKNERAVARLEAALNRHRNLVAQRFRETLAGGDHENMTRASDVAHAAWRAAFDHEAGARALEAMGFARPAESVAHLELLVAGPSHAPSSPRRTELLGTLGPVLLDEISQLADPDLALQNLASFIAAVGARTSFLALLEQHPATRRVLLRLFASSSYLSTVFIRHPDMLDTLVRSDLAHVRREPADLEEELASLIAATPDFESKLDAIRTFRHQEFLRIAIADIAGHLSLAEVESELSLLAETVLRQALRLAQLEVAARLAISVAPALCCIAMGRLGAAEMSYNSDLDLIFVYEGEGERMSGREIASKIAQKLIAILEARTREGYAYKLDVRLRPSGNQGPLVTSLEGFREYHRQSSAVWERQALVRARAIAGDAELAQRVEAARNEFVYGRGLRPEEVAEIAAMRARMEREIGAETAERLNLKQGRGGLVDVEFVAQTMALAHGAAHRELRIRSTRELIAAAARLSLLNDGEARSLADGYEFLSRLENRLRIESDQAVWALPTAPGALKPLARRMGYAGEGGPRRLLTDLNTRREAIRAAFETVFAREQTVAAQ